MVWRIPLTVIGAVAIFVSYVSAFVTGSTRADNGQGIAGLPPTGPLCQGSARHPITRPIRRRPAFPVG